MSTNASMDTFALLNNADEEENGNSYLNTTSIVVDLEVQVDVQNPLGAD